MHSDAEKEPAMEFLTKDELLKVLAEAKHRGSREHAMFLLGYMHGLRASEICGLTLSDVRDGKLSVQRLKGSLHSIQQLATNRNPLLDERLALKTWLADRGDADGSVMLFTSRNGSGLSRQQLHNIFEAICIRSGIDSTRRHCHILKHSLAVHLRQSGMDVFTLQIRLGHRDIKSTACYTHVSDSEASIATAQAMSRIFA
jgi:site-specific recombinase XerD